MKFNSPDMERAWCQARQEKVFLIIVRFSVAFALYWGFFFGVRSWLRIAGTRQDEVAIQFNLPLNWTNLAHIAFVTIHTACAVLFRIPWVKDRVGLKGAEALIGVLTLQYLAYGNYWIQTDVAWILPEPGAVPSIYLAYIINWMISVHALVGLRWYVLVFLDALLMVWFVVWWCVWTRPDPDYITMLSFVCWALMTIAGARSMELTDRALFASVVDERTLRACAEFRRDMVNSSSGEGGGRAKGQPNLFSSSMSQTALSFGESQVSVTETHAVFVRAQTVGRQEVPPNERSDALQGIIELGKQEQWLITDEELKLNSSLLLGKGGQARVFTGQFCCSPVAVKIYEQRKNQLNLHALNELRILRHVRHPNILLFHGAHIRSGQGDSFELSLVLELVIGQPLCNYLWVCGDAPDVASSRRSITRGVCEALIYLHTRRPCIVHSDIKLGNIMVEHREGHPFTKLLDFGLSHTATRIERLSGGTRNYIAPEIKSDPFRKPSPAVDVFSFGRLLEAVAGPSPSSDLDPREQDLDGQGGEAPGGRPSQRWPASAELQAEWDTAILRCTQRDADDRPPMSEVYRNIFSCDAGLQEALQIVRDLSLRGPGGAPAAPPTDDKVCSPDCLSL